MPVRHVRVGRLCRSIGLAATLLVALAMSAGPVGAWQLVGSQHGLVGPYTLVDSNDAAHAGAVCHYLGSPTDYFRSMAVRPPRVWAADRTGARDHRIVGLRVRLQRATSPTGTWTTIRTSSEQRATAYDDTPAVFHATKLFWQSSHTNVLYRALETIKWYHAGSVEGSVTLRVQFYRADAPDASPTSVTQDYCQNVID